MCLKLRQEKIRSLRCTRELALQESASTGLEGGKRKNARLAWANGLGTHSGGLHWELPARTDEVKRLGQLWGLFFLCPALVTWQCPELGLPMDTTMRKVMSQTQVKAICP